VNGPELAFFTAVTFCAAPVILVAAALTFVETVDRDERIDLAAIVGTTAPLFVSLVVSVLYSATILLPLAWTPTLSQSATSLVVLSVLTIVAAYGRRHFISVYRDTINFFRSIRPPKSAVGWLALALVLLALVQALALPVMENDALEYAAVAKYILRQGGLASYPLLQADPQTGLFAPSSHPPAYHMLLAWGFSLAGTESMAPLRITAVFFIAGTAFLVLRITRMTAYPGLAVLVLFSTPLFVSMAVSYHIDAMRLTAFTAGCAITARFVRKPCSRESILIGYILGLAMYSHSIGILAIPLTGAAFLLLADVPIRTKLQLGILCCIVACGVGGLQYVKNLIQFGTPIQDSVPIFQIEQIDYESDLRARRDLVTFFDRTIFGVLRGFFELPSFGFTFWAGLGAAAAAIWRWRGVSLIEQVFWIVVILYFVLNALSAALGFDLMIKNPRYVMTLVPLLGCLIASAASRYIQMRE